MLQMILVNLSFSIDIIEIILVMLNDQLELLPWVLVHRDLRNVQRKRLKLIPFAVQGVVEYALGVVLHVVAEAEHKFIFLIISFDLLVLNHLATHVKFSDFGPSSILFIEVCKVPSLLVKIYSSLVACPLFKVLLINLIKLRVLLRNFFRV